MKGANGPSLEESFQIERCSFLIKDMYVLVMKNSFAIIRLKIFLCLLFRCVYGLGFNQAIKDRK